MLLGLKRASRLRVHSSFSTMSSILENIAGICQMRSTNDKKFNREQVEELTKRAEGKSSFLFFPECADYVGTNVEETKALAESLDGDTVKFYKDLWYFFIIMLHSMKVPS